MTQILPIQAADLDEVGQFLHKHLGHRFSVEAWIASLTQTWAAAPPNLGMHLRHEGRVVGVLCAIYSDQIIDGRPERFCNPHSWVVLEPHRNHSIGLLLQLLKQRDCHFTMFTPNPKVAQVFQGLRFRVLDDALLYLPHLPSWRWLEAGSTVEDDPARIEALLEGVALQDFRAHRHLPWLRFVAFGRAGSMGLAIYKRTRWKKLPCAAIAYLSNPETMARDGHLLQRHLLLRQGLMVSRIEARLLPQASMPAIRARRTQPKLVLSRTLSDAQVRDVYSELMALDL